ncbi:hypothetical protein GWK47_020469 [Chionoecetes opilio]|uniref:Uncharacterized protein n=1 Tax=Chionoecetes opilio TaxID=41210 RepID=A0A8J5BW90_CHIOP|nr:hypothetical protein GWK47_020469 [Chionoecetes opilio]
MSEKRHATLDAKNTDTYQRNKKAREEREKQRQIMLAQEKLAAMQGLGAPGMAGSNQSAKLSAKQQFMQGLRGPGGRRGSEPVGATLGRGLPGHPRGTFSPVSRSLERHYAKDRRRTTFGQDLSNMISTWGN